MRKLHLKLESLQVESFPVAAEGRSGGTVHANGYSAADTCSGGMLCDCGTWEHTYCLQCETDEPSYCVTC